MYIMSWAMHFGVLVYTSVLWQCSQSTITRAKENHQRAFAISYALVRLENHVIVVLCRQNICWT